MMDGKGNVVYPDELAVYYKAVPGTKAMPRGLRMIFGYNMKLAADKQTEDLPYWNCDGPGAVPGTYPNIKAQINAGCPATARLGVVIHTPECWDGVRLDSPDHRSHVAYKVLEQNSGQYLCPAGYPVLIPQFTMGAWFSHGGPNDLKNWYLSSDRMPGMPAMEPGMTFHSDWFGAWDDDIMDTWVKNAIGQLRNCSDGELGDGRQMIRPPGFSYTANPRLIPEPK